MWPKRHRRYCQMPYCVVSMSSPKEVPTFFLKTIVGSTRSNDKKIDKKAEYYRDKNHLVVFDIIENMSHSLAIITVVYENYTVLTDFLSSLQKQVDKNFYLYIVDASVNPKNITSHVPHEIIRVKNKGYAHGLNTGIQHALQAGYSSFSLVNCDVVFGSDFVQEVRKSISLHPSSLIGGKIYYAAGYEYHKNRYSKNDRGHVIWYAGGNIDWNNAYTPHIGVDEVDNEKFSIEKPVSFVTGCLMCLDKKTIKTVGLLSESYFMFYEDADYSVRVAQKNLPIIYDPSIVLWHKSGQSTDGSGSKMQVKFQARSMFRFGIMYAPWKTKFHLLKNFFFSKK